MIDNLSEIFYIEEEALITQLIQKTQRCCLTWYRLDPRRFYTSLVENTVPTSTAWEFFMSEVCTDRFVLTILKNDVPHVEISNLLFDRIDDLLKVIKIYVANENQISISKMKIEENLKAAGDLVGCSFEDGNQYHQPSLGSGSCTLVPNGVISNEFWEAGGDVTGGLPTELSELVNEGFGNHDSDLGYVRLPADDGEVEGPLQLIRFSLDTTGCSSPITRVALRIAGRIETWPGAFAVQVFLARNGTILKNFGSNHDLVASIKHPSTGYVEIEQIWPRPGYPGESVNITDLNGLELLLNVSDKFHPAIRVTAVEVVFN